VEGHNSRLELLEERNLELENKIQMKEKKKKEILVKQLKSCDRNMQELSNSIKRPNLRIIGIEEEEVQAKRICNIFNKIITENFANLEKVLPIQYRKPPGHQTD
jgi:hypothetical protein